MTRVGAGRVTAPQAPLGAASGSAAQGPGAGARGDRGRADRGARAAAELVVAGLARRHGGHQPGHRPGALRAARHLGVRPGVHDQAGHGGGGAARARARTPGSAPGSCWPRGGAASGAARSRSSWSAAATRRWPRGSRPPPTTRRTPRSGRWRRRPPGRCGPAAPRRSGSGYDTSLYTGPGLAPGWPRSYVTTGNVTPISSLEVDQGRLTAAGRRRTPTIRGTTCRGRSPRPPRPRSAFARLPGRRRHPGDRRPGAAGRAGRSGHAGARCTRRRWPRSSSRCCRRATTSSPRTWPGTWRIATGRPASFSGAAAAETAVAAQAGRDRGAPGATAAGCRRGTGSRRRALVASWSRLAAADRPRLRAAITGLPVAGFSGTLAPGGSVFAEAGRAALGVVRAKTGNLTHGRGAGRHRLRQGRPAARVRVHGGQARAWAPWTRPARRSPRWLPPWPAAAAAPAERIAGSRADVSAAGAGRPRTVGG